MRATWLAPQAITHFRRLKNSRALVSKFLKVASALKGRLGPVLFQLPPNFKKDIPRFESFLDTLPPGTVAAFEFRNGSWFDDELYQRLRARNLALCIADSETRSTPVEITADYAYFRLRDEGYTPSEIKEWAKTIQEKTAACKEVYVYFKHEEAGKGPEFAKVLLEAFAKR